MGHFLNSVLHLLSSGWLSHHPPPPLHFKSSFTISALYHFPSPPVCLLVFHTHRHLSSPYLSFHDLLTVNAPSRCPSQSSHLHQAIALPFFGFRRCLCTPKLKTLSQLSWFMCLCLASVFPLLLFFCCRRLSPISYHRPRSVFPFRQLMENKITTIERGAFQDLKELERLWVTLCNQRQRDCESWNAVVRNADCQSPILRSINPGSRREGWCHTWLNRIPFEKQTDRCVADGSVANPQLPVSTCKTKY